MTEPISSSSLESTLSSLADLTDENYAELIADYIAYPARMLLEYSTKLPADADMRLFVQFAHACALSLVATFQLARGTDESLATLEDHEMTAQVIGMTYAGLYNLMRGTAEEKLAAYAKLNSAMDTLASHTQARTRQADEPSVAPTKPTRAIPTPKTPVEVLSELILLNSLYDTKTIH